MPEVSYFYGIAIYMYMSEHNPPHFHVKYQDYEAIITIEGGVVTGSLPRMALNLVYEWLDLHKNELMEKVSLGLTNLMQVLRTENRYSTAL